MIDGNYGFEMETMEFLNVLNSSGMPGNVFGILTHLDLFRKQEALKAQKKRLKHRFWTELYNGAKLFYLSGVINGRYPDREILNLSRFLSIMKKPRPIIFRQSHPYCLADRFLDITPPTLMEENPKCDRTIALYGYLRGGTNFSSEGAKVHIPGLGDQNVLKIEPLPDPCPTPYVQQAIEKATGKQRARRLGDKQKVLYAPMSDVGGVLIDRDAVYIDVKSMTLNNDDDENEERGLGEQLMVNLQGDRKLLGQADSGLQLFTGSTSVQPQETADDVEGSGRKFPRHARFIEEREDVDDVSDDEAYESADDDENEEIGTENGEDNEFDEEESENIILNGQGNGLSDDVRVDGDIAFADSDSDIGSVSSAEDQQLEDTEYEDSDENDNDGALRWKQDLQQTARNLHGQKKPYRTVELARLIYNDSLTPAEVLQKWTQEGDQEEENNEEDFFKKTESNTALDEEDTLIQQYNYETLEEKWGNSEIFENLRNKFTAMGLQRLGDEENGDNEFNGFDEMDNGDDGNGEFEDLETGEKFGEPAKETGDTAKMIEEEREVNAKKKEELKLRFETEDRDGFLNDKANGQNDGVSNEEFGEDNWYDAQKSLLEKQQSINRAEFDRLDEVSRVRVEGYKAGTYARIILTNVPHEFCNSFNARYPLIIGGITSTEDRFGYLQVRIKRHRWHKKILKTNDPLIFSLGWRRFQTMPIYSISDSRTRNRMLKYTPEHMHCFATIYGPLIAPATPFCCVQSFSSSNPGFRIAATGVVLNVDESVEIVKKLKLTGHPYKIFRNTAFIKNMFNSALEIAKFEGASIRTVSGVRGQIKRALSKPEGHYRATFEDKILMSDIVFLRAWYPIKPHRFYNPVTNLLGNNDQEGWVGMRLTGEVRQAHNIETPKDRNSAYRKVEREQRHFNPLRIPRKLATDLPFKSQPVQTLPQRKETYMQKRAVLPDAEEKKARNLMQQVLTLRRDKEDKRRVSKEKHREQYRKKVVENEEKRKEREKKETEEFWRREGKKRNAWEQKGGSQKRHKTS